MWHLKSWLEKRHFNLTFYDVSASISSFDSIEFRIWGMSLNWIRSFWFSFLTFVMKCVGRFTTKRQQKRSQKNQKSESNLVETFVVAFLGPKVTDVRFGCELIYVESSEWVWMEKPSLKRVAIDRTRGTERRSQWWFLLSAINDGIESIERLKIV